MRNYANQELSVCARDDVLWPRLESFEIDIPSSSLQFSERAARDNAWSIGFTRRVIQEYKKFLFLAKRADHIVTPSDAVDQIWHMHLTYTHSYWDELCKDVLQAPLHHGPTKGGKEEKEKYFTLYEKTRKSYEEWFGEKPPLDIWPEPEVRFGSDLHYVRINSDQNWIIPKLSKTKMFAGAAAAGMAFPLAQLAANPLDWNGPQFLTLFSGLLIVAIIASIVLRRMLLQSDGKIDVIGRDEDFGPVEAAWLEGGDHRAVSCSLLDLAQKHAVYLDGSNVHPGPTIATYRPTHRITSLIQASVTSADVGRSWRVMCRDASAGLIALRQDLENKGLVTSATQRNMAVAATISTVGAVVVLGAAKIVIGIGRDRPVGYLLIGEILAILGLVVLISSIPRLTATGKKLLKRLKADVAQNPSETNMLDSQAQTSEGSTHDNTLLWSAALLGPAVLATTPFAEYDTFMRSQTSGIGTGAAHGGCGTGCSGDSGGGGGCGGGCGGCGGCGG